MCQTFTFVMAGAQDCQNGRLSPKHLKSQRDLTGEFVGVELKISKKIEGKHKTKKRHEQEVRDVSNR